MFLKIRPRVQMTAELWQGEPLEGFERVAGPEGPLLTIQCLDGSIYATVGDWIIRGHNGNTFACPAAAFEENYEVIDGQMAEETGHHSS